MGTKADKICTNKCPSLNNTNTNTKITQQILIVELIFGTTQTKWSRGDQQSKI